MFVQRRRVNDCVVTVFVQRHASGEGLMTVETVVFVQRQGSGEGLMTVVTALFVQRRRVNDSAVSYTHLTLPTTILV